MIQILLLIFVALFFQVMRRSGIVAKLSSSSESRNCTPIILGVLAWAGIALLSMGLGQVFAMVIDILSDEFDYMSLIQIAAAALAIFSVYQALVSSAEPGWTGSTWDLFVRSFLFRTEAKVLRKVPEKPDQLKAPERVKKEPEIIKLEDLEKPPKPANAKDKDIENYFGS